MPGVQFSYNHCRHILKRAGAVQVSPEAVEELRGTIEEIAFDISKRALLFADHKERFKVKREDVIAATKEFLESHTVLRSV